MRLGDYELGPNDTPENGIYLGDCRVLVKTIPDESVDVIFTSPPYNVGMDYGVYDDSLPEEEFWRFQGDWLADAFRVSKEGTRFYAVVGDSMLWGFRSLAEVQGWRFHQLLVWCKPNLVGHGRISKDWNTLSEWCLLFHKGKRTPMQAGPRGVNTHNWIVEASAQSNFGGLQRKVFSAQMAYRVAYNWLARTPGDVIWEPFAGSGTTCMAAKTLGRHYLAVEFDPVTCELARGRTRQMQPPLFIPQKEQLDLM